MILAFTDSILDSNFAAGFLLVCGLEWSRIFVLCSVRACDARYRHIRREDIGR